MKKGTDYIGVGAGALVFNDAGEVLLGLRGPATTNESGKWEFPGGGIEFGETAEAAIVREIREEFGIEIEVVEMLDWVDHILPEEGQHWVSVTYITRLISGTPSLLEPDKCTAIKWLEVEEINESELSFVSISNLRKYREKVGA